MDFIDYIYPIECLKERVHNLADMEEHLRQSECVDESVDNLVSQLAGLSNWMNRELFELTKLANKTYCNDDYEFYAIPQFNTGVWGVIKIIHYLLFRKSLGIAAAKRDLTKRFYIVNNQVKYIEEQLRYYRSSSFVNTIR